jgi:hypothetical protein
MVYTEADYRGRSSVRRYDDESYDTESSVHVYFSSPAPGRLPREDVRWCSTRTVVTVELNDAMSNDF